MVSDSSKNAADKYCHAPAVPRVRQRREQHAVNVRTKGQTNVGAALRGTEPSELAHPPEGQTRRLSPTGLLTSTLCGCQLEVPQLAARKTRGVEELETDEADETNEAESDKVEANKGEVDEEEVEKEDALTDRLVNWLVDLIVDRHYSLPAA